MTVDESDSVYESRKERLTCLWTRARAGKNDGIALDRLEVAEIGRRLGHDLVRFRRKLDRKSLPPSVLEGVALAEARRLSHETADRYVGKWLQLRLNAFRRGRVVDEKITPDYLRRIDVDHCPVLRIALTYGLVADTDWSVDRINNDGAYAPNNLAIMSVRANRAKGNHGFEAVLARAQVDGATDGLTAPEWLRMAALMLGPSFVAQASRAPVLPLVAVAPCAAQPASQVVQFAFTTGAARQAGRNALTTRFHRVCRDESAHVRLDRFAEIVHRALKDVTPCWDVWLRPDVFGAFRAWWSSLDGASRALAGSVAMAVSHSTALSGDRIRGWQLADRGYAQ